MKGGEIIGDYEYSPELMEYKNIRKVNWLGEVERDKLTTSTKNSLGAISIASFESQFLFPKAVKRNWIHPVINALELEIPALMGILLSMII